MSGDAMACARAPAGRDQTLDGALGLDEEQIFVNPHLGNPARFSREQLGELPAFFFSIRRLLALEYTVAHSSPSYLPTRPARGPPRTATRGDYESMHETEAARGKMSPRRASRKRSQFRSLSERFTRVENHGARHRLWRTQAML